MSRVRSFLQSRGTDAIIGFLIVVPGFLLLIGIGFSLLSVWNGNTEATSHYSSFVTAFGTMVLVGVTMWYASITSDIADEHQKDREIQNDLREQAAQGLRRALIEEIMSDSNYDDILDWELMEIVNIQSWRNDRIYVQNSTRMHLLTPLEVKKIVEFYTQQKAVDDICNSYEDLGDVPEDEVGRTHERITNEIGDLCDKQEEAETALRENLTE